jgi:hypothetical protein
MAAGAATGASGDLERARRRPSSQVSATRVGLAGIHGLRSDKSNQASAGSMGFRRVLVRIQIGPSACQLAAHHSYRATIAAHDTDIGYHIRQGIPRKRKVWSGIATSAE